MKSRKEIQLNDKLNKRWLGYAAAAGVGVLGTMQPAKADIIYTISNTPLGSSTPIDLNHDGVTDFSIINQGFWSFYRANGMLSVAPGVAGNGVHGSIGYGYGNIAAALPAGWPIGPEQVFTTGGGRDVLMGTWRAFYERLPYTSRVKFSGTSFGPWQGFYPWTAYLGFRFSIDGQNHYGWGYLTVVQDHNSGGYDGTLISYAYDTVADQGILSGQTVAATPEPGTLALLALGSLCLGFWRRRRAVGTLQ